MKYFHFIPAACIFLFCQCGGQDSHFLSDTKYIPVFSEDSCQYIDHGDNLHFTGAFRCLPVLRQYGANMQSIG